MTAGAAQTAVAAVTVAAGPAELLAVWEAGLGLDDPGRALLLHRTARPEAGDGELLSAPVGEREADLFALRRALFGERMQVRVECEPCGEAMEFDLGTDGLSARPPRRDAPLRVAEGDWEVEFRLPTVADLVAVAEAVEGGRAAEAGHGTEDGQDPDGVPARALLAARCAVSARRAGRPVPADRLPALLPETVLRRVAEAAEQADPAADVTLQVHCPECGGTTRAELDIASYLWAELDTWARELLLDVHLLAGAYGWTEPEILALSPLRRRYYLELCADA
ncbi:hypothetical protein L7D48_24585 [Streptomyces sp. S1A]|uniref:T4 family baseplate hub assembly chaperone n=1 Tax=Streptomyces sp. ICN903 TaxID=2964654 RepID=UPI001EDC4A1A|nr:hypothetical protein [Streptomyces sp. ICN903]MCG3043711.1 hypothetical protein [Streptomyces sp. ICN903]